MEQKYMAALGDNNIIKNNQMGLQTTLPQCLLEKPSLASSSKS